MAWWEEDFVLWEDDIIDLFKWILELGLCDGEDLVIERESFYITDEEKEEDKQWWYDRFERWKAFDGYTIWYYAEDGRSDYAKNKHTLKFVSPTGMETVLEARWSPIDGVENMDWYGNLYVN